MNITTGGVNGRRKTALERLEKQLNAKVKQKKMGQEPEPLTDVDVKRIQSEITILKTKIS